MEEQNVNQTNFNLPHDVLTLPSGGKFYKNKKKSVKVGFLTAADENILASASNMSGDQVIQQLIRAKVYEPDLKIDDMLEGDIEAILVFLRNTAFGPEYNVNLTDPETGNKFESTFSLDELNFSKPEVDPDENGHYTTTLPKSGKTVKLKLLTFGDKKELSDRENSYPKNMVTPKVTWRLLKQIISIDNNEDKTEIAKFVEKMPIMDSKFITNFINKNQPSLDLIKEITAPSGKSVLTRVTFGAEFFRPFF